MVVGPTTWNSLLTNLLDPVDIRPHQPAAQPTSRLKGFWAHQLGLGLGCSFGVQMSTWSGANVPMCDELRRPADIEARRRLRSASSRSLDVQRTRLSTVGDRAFPVAAARLWNSLPPHVTASVSLHHLLLS